MAVDKSIKTMEKGAAGSGNSTLDFMEVAEVRDGIVILREGQMRTIMAVSSANFALKSSKEQDMLIGAFQGLLNSLESPMQILVQSRKLNLTNYIEKLRTLEGEQTNDLLKIKMQEYIEYIQEMLQQINIMNKDFYVIIGHEPGVLKEDLFGKFFRALNPTKYIKQEQDDFNRNKQIMKQKAESIMSRFSGLDLKVRILKTEQIIALMYNSYNPDTLESIRLGDVSDLDVQI